jgi:membrane protein required for colicin V production
MDVNYFDLAVGVVILLLGLKGIINGFFKELFGLLGIGLGLFIASRYGSIAGELLSDTIFHFENNSAISFSGFLVTFAAIWLGAILIGMSFKKLSHMSGLGPVDKILGFILGSSKFLIIFSVIAFSINNIKAIEQNIAPKLNDSILYPILINIGETVMSIDPQTVSEELEEKLEEVSEDMKEKIEESKDSLVNEKAENIKKIVIQKMSSEEKE